MRRRIVIIVIAMLMTLMMMPLCAFAETASTEDLTADVKGSDDLDWSTLEPGVDYVDGEIVVTFVDDLESEDMIYDIAYDNGFTVLEIMGFSEWVMGGGKVAAFIVPEGMTVPEAIDKIELDPRVRFATPNGVFSLYGSTYPNMTRIYGTDRYETAFAAADKVYSKHGEPFDRIIVASGTDYPDALTGSKLANNERPLILVSNATEGRTLNYIQNRVKEGGTVYLLGGTGAVSQEFEDNLISDGYEVKRLGGKDRYETNISVLTEMHTEANVMWGFERVTVVSGKDFPDALCGSTTGVSLLLVGDKLTESQKQYLDSIKISHFLIVGGTSAVGESIEQELSAYAETKRIGGKDRYETSELLAMECFDTPYGITFATGQSFADGIVAGAFNRSYGVSGPVVLASNPRGQSSIMRTYIDSIYPKDPPVYVFGGQSLISDYTIGVIMGVQ